MNRVKNWASLLLGVSFDDWLLLVDEESYHEAGLVRGGVKSFFQSFDQSLVISDGTLLIGTWSLVCKEEYITRILYIAVVKNFLVVTGLGLSISFGLVLNVYGFDLLGGFVKVFKRVWQSIAFVFLVTEAKTSLKHSLIIMI